jgi:hypothetical protein
MNPKPQLALLSLLAVLTVSAAATLLGCPDDNKSAPAPAATNSAKPTSAAPAATPASTGTKPGGW